jgi:hypothetical protein
MNIVESLAANLGLDSFLSALQATAGRYELLDHWKQGEFHHDLVLRVPTTGHPLPGPVVVVATNCNGGVKEVLCFAELPGRSALWHQRCPDNPEFGGKLPSVLASARTVHWFDPCSLLTLDARSELKPEFRERQPGGGWQMKGCAIDETSKPAPPN